jgi:SAM-dependent methyltransferase
MSAEVFFRALQVPVLQNRMFESAAAARESQTGDVVLGRDPLTGIVCNIEFDSDLVEYGTDYQNEQAHSAVFQKHLAQVEAVVARHFVGKKILEVGCGKGRFLEELRSRGFDVVGLDPAYEGDNPHIQRIGLGDVSPTRREAVILRHVLEHVQNPLSFLELIKASVRGSRLIYIEVPCLDWILANRAWFDVFYEHVNYFSLADFDRLFGTVLACGRLFGGQYIFVVADLSSLRKPDGASAVVFPPDFESSRETAVALARKSERCAIWGAGAKGSLLAAHLARCNATKSLLAIDINPAKQGRYLPGSGLPVIAPELALRTLRARDPIFVMNSNYLEEVINLSDNRFSYISMDHHDV